MTPAAAVNAGRLIVGVSDAKVSRDPASTLVTYALGSCVAVSMFDSARGVAGLLHLMLPDSSLDRTKAEENPWMFADTGIPALLRAMGHGGGARGVIVCLAGGAQVLNDASLFSIGKRNYAAVRKALWKAGLMVEAEVVGGEVSRTVRVEVGTGRVWVRESCGVDVEIAPKDRRYAR